MTFTPSSRRSLIAGIATCAVVAALTVGCRSAIHASGSRPSAAIVDEARIPAAAFFRRPLLSHVTLSPDGQQIAAIMARDGKETLVVRATKGGALRALTGLERTPSRSSWTIGRVGWGSDRQILISINMPSATAVGVNARQSRLLVVDVETGKIHYLGERWPDQAYSQYQDSVISWLPDDPDRILIDLWLPAQPGSGARAVNLGNGVLETVANPRYGTTHWFADHLGRVRAGGGEPRSGTDQFILARASTDERFEEILRFDPFEEQGFSFAGFAQDPQILYVGSNERTGRNAIYTYDLAERRLGDVVFAHPDVDVGDVQSSEVDGRPLFVSYTTDRPRLHFLDPAAERTWLGITKALPHVTNEYTSWDRAEKLFIVRSSGDVHPPRYYLSDSEKKRLDLLFSAYPELEEAQLAPMKAIEYPARDGLVIHGYLTVPVKGTAPHPTIVLAHGGPWARDVWGWDPVVQFLASRGFAVLQPNFRGSDGYGREFRERGHGSWGLAMQDDITDGALWLVNEGIADGERIGIYGASYGGFAALQAMIKEPDLFRAGASFAGVTDLLALLADSGSYWGLRDDLEELIGDRWKDRARLRSSSPVHNADKIRGPILIAHGTEDARVHVRQARSMISALGAEDVPVEALIYDGELHGFIDKRNEIDFYTKLAAFFERNLAPPSPAGRP